jgi:hypothetical protein
VHFRRRRRGARALGAGSIGCAHRECLAAFQLTLSIVIDQRELSAVANVRDGVRQRQKPDANGYLRQSTPRDAIAETNRNTRATFHGDAA